MRVLVIGATGSSDAAVGKTFELFASPGTAPADWDGLFADLAADTPGALDGARDPDGPRLEEEPSEVQEDVDRLSAAVAD